MHKFKRVFIMGALLMLLIITAAAVYAMVSGEISFLNKMRTGSVNVRIEQYEETDEGEKLIEPGMVLANEDVSCIPQVTNLRAASYVRVKADIKMEKEIPEPITLDCIYGLNEDWVLKGEYFYYTKVLEPMESSRLFQGIRIPESWDNDISSGFKTELTVDAIQAVNFIPDFEAEMPWGNIEIQNAKETDNTVYRVAESADDEGAIKLRENVLSFSESAGLESNTADLFQNFDGFMAGDMRSDTLVLENNSKGPVQVSFCTDTNSSELLKKAELEIRCGGERIYKGKLLTEPLYQYIDLITLDQNEKEEFEFKVDVPEDSQNDYSVLEDQVTWKFKAQGTSEDLNVQTGDSSNLAGYFAAALAAVLCGAALFIGNRGKKSDKSN